MLSENHSFQIFLKLLLILYACLNIQLVVLGSPGLDVHLTHKLRRFTELGYRNMEHNLRDLNAKEYQNRNAVSIDTLCLRGK